MRSLSSIASVTSTMPIRELTRPRSMATRISMPGRGVTSLNQTVMRMCRQSGGRSRNRRSCGWEFRPRPEGSEGVGGAGLMSAIAGCMQRPERFMPQTCVHSGGLPSVDGRG